MNLAADIRVDLTGWFNNFQYETDAALGDMLQLCTASQEKRYSNTGLNHVGVFSVVIQNADVLGESAPQRAARNSFVSAMCRFSGFLDRLIASQRLVKNGVSASRELNGEAEVFAYVAECFEETVIEVAQDKGLNVPKKIDCFPGIDRVVREMALNYNKLTSP
jgi:hypothetical protein